VVPALVLSIVLVVPVAALTYRWIEKPALDGAKRGVSVRAVVARLLSPRARTTAAA
jgi:peptidoglycan/LPS O-acetylase OafA/YrhL